jgi:hypothetical protein
MKVLRVFCGVLILASSSVFAVGNTAVITLDFPFGAENAGLGESGVSHAKNIYTLWYNPANLPAVYDETYSNIMYGHFYEHLLPSFRIPDLWHTADPFCVIANKVFPNIDLAMGLFDNHINFGRNEITDSLGNTIRTVLSDETVWSYSLAGRWLDLVSAGVSIKSVYSRLAPSIGPGPTSGTAKGLAYDIGLRLGKRISFFDIVELQPALGVSWQNLGDWKVYYIKPEDWGPIGKKVLYGGSFGVNVLELFEYTFIREIDRSLIPGYWDEVIKHWGYRMQISPFYCLTQGKMDDPAGNRHETSTGCVISFNFRKTIDMILKVCTLSDKINGTDSYKRIKEWDEGFRFGSMACRPNIYISSAVSKIHTSGDNNVREGQTRTDFCFGIGFTGSFPADMFRTVKTPAPLQKPVAAPGPQPVSKPDSTRTVPEKIKIEDGELVE